MLDDERECLGAALKSLGYSLNSTNQEELDAATHKLIEQKPLVHVYDSVNMKRNIVQGQWLVHMLGRRRASWPSTPSAATRRPRGWSPSCARPRAT